MCNKIEIIKIILNRKIDYLSLVLSCLRKQTAPSAGWIHFLLGYLT